MYFGEPQRTQLDLNFSLFGIPVRVSPWFWLGSAIFGYNLTSGNPQWLLLWELAVFISILVHEMGHALVIRYFGDQPWVTLVLMGGLASSRSVSRHPREQIMVSIAGPAAQILLAVLVLVLVRLSGHVFPYQIPFWPESWPDLNGLDQPRFSSIGLEKFTFYLVWPSIVWAVLNLVPVFPLDGGQIARAALTIFNPSDGVRQSLLLSAIAGAAVAVYGFKIQQPYMGLMFGMLAFDSFQAYQAYRGGGVGRW